MTDVARNSPMLHLRSRKYLRLRILLLETQLFAIEEKWRRQAARSSRLERDRDVLLRVLRRIGPVMIRGAVANDDVAQGLLKRHGIDFEFVAPGPPPVEHDAPRAQGGDIAGKGR